MSATPYFPFYPADYMADTAHLTTEQHGAYLLLLMTAWSRGGRLPADPKKLARIARVSARRWHLMADDLMEFWEQDGDEIVSPRLEREYQKAVSKSEKRSASGKRGGLAKALKNKERGLANAKQNPCHSPEPEPEKERVPNGTPKKGSRLSPDWIPQQEHIDYAAEQGLTPEETHHEAENFRDYWIAKPGAGGVKLDWTATWRTWVRRSAERRNQQRGGSPAHRQGGRERQGGGSLADAALRLVSEG